MNVNESTLLESSPWNSIRSIGSNRGLHSESGEHLGMKPDAPAKMMEGPAKHCFGPAKYAYDSLSLP